jgi:hypothetical protein
MPSYTSGTPLPPRPETVPAGKYRLRVIDAEETVVGGTGKVAGAEMFKLKLDVLGSVDGKLNFDPESNPGPLVFDNLIFAPTTGWRVDQYRAARGEVVTPGVPVIIEADEFHGDEIEAVLAIEQVRDKTTNKPTGKLRMEVKGFIAAKEPHRGERAAADDIPF